MNKMRLFASTRNNGSAQSGLARVSAAFVVLIGIVLLVMSGCGENVTVPIPVPTKPIDIDGDKLIDIHNLDMLNNIRYNLAGTSYKTSDAGAGIACGEMGTIDCIGYELMRDLDFNHYSSYENNNGKIEWLPNSHNPSKATNTGWKPLGIDGAWTNPHIIGKPERTFSAIFEGNSYSISNLYSRGVYDSGLFDIIIGTVRNLTIVNGNVYAGSGNNKAGILAGSVFRGGLVINCATRGGSAHGGDGNDAVGGLVGYLSSSTVVASYSTASAYADIGTVYKEYIGGLVGVNRSGTIIASYAAGTAHGGTGADSVIGGLVGSVGVAYNRDYRDRIYPRIIASYVTGNTYGGTGGHEAIGGLVGDIPFSGSNKLIAASYTISKVNGDFNGGGSFYDSVAPFAGFGNEGSVADSYAFGTASSASMYLRFGGDDSDDLQVVKGLHQDQKGSFKPNGVTYAGDLTASNAGATWNSAASLTASAWAFDASYGAPALKYADYDGSGGVDYCAHFPAGSCNSNRLLPNQPVVDQGGSRQSAYVVDTQLYPGIGTSIPAKLTIGDSDYFQITVEEAGLLIIESDSGINTQAMLYASNGTELEYDDNDGVGNNFKISRAVSRGVFYIRAYGYSNQAGPYTLGINLMKCVAGVCGGKITNDTGCAILNWSVATSASRSRHVSSCTYPAVVACPNYKGWDLSSFLTPAGGTTCLWQWSAR